METTKQLGIWMDHSIAYLMELSNGIIVTNTIESKSVFLERKENLKLDESLMQNKEQNKLMDYFRKISNVIKDYDEVLLFGPAEAKNKLLNILKDDHHFDKINITIKLADKMTENQQQAFVKQYFNSIR